jgi:hypothetical protein
MGAIYGIIGETGRAELEAMGARLAHRGRFGAQWSPAPGVWFGMQCRELVERATDGPLLFDGALDNRWQLTKRRGAARARLDPGAQNSLRLERIENQHTRAAGGGPKGKRPPPGGAKKA